MSPNAPRDIPVRLQQLKKFYDWRDVLTVVFDDDEDAFLDAWCDGSLPFAVRKTCEETLDPHKLTNLLLRRLVRLQHTTLVQILALRKPLP